MKRLKKLAASSAVTMTALVLAVALLGFSGIGGARAALTYYSEDYVSTMQLQEIGVTLQENGATVATGHEVGAESDRRTSNPLLARLKLPGEGEATVDVAENEPFRLGTHYVEVLDVFNPTANGVVKDAANITQYVRVTIYRYWAKVTDTTSTKHTELKPSYIQLWLNGADGNAVNLDTEAGVKALADNGWLVDTDATTTERLVLYYNKPVKPEGVDGSTGLTNPFADHFSIDPIVGLLVNDKNEFLYKDMDFCLEIRVDAVQDHNAEDAIRSAWGANVTISEDGTLSLG